MSGSDILEGRYDRPPAEGYSDVHSTGRSHDGYVAEGLCSPIRQLEKAVVRLQQDIADYRAELKLNRTQTPAVSTRHWDSVQTTWKLRPDAGGACSGKVVTMSRPRPVVSPSAPTELEQSMRPFLAEQRRRRRRPRRRRPSPAIGDGDNHAVDKLSQRLGTETQSCPPPVVSPPAPTELGQLMCSFIAGQRRRRRPPRRQRPARRDWSDVLCFSCGNAAWVMQHART